MFRTSTAPLRLILLSLTLLLGACGEPPQTRFPPLPDRAAVLVVGDSLVAGTGASRDQAWPEVLARSTGWDVINAGVPGHTSADAQRRLAGLIESHQPEAIIIAIGGNDFLRSVDEADTRRNIEAMIAHSKTVTPHVALVAIPAVSLGSAVIGNLSDHAMYAQIAREHELALVPAAVADTLSRAEFRADRIHANAAGYAFMAERIERALAEQGWRR
jgi:acyl-CoA thioesterase I